MSFNLWSDEDRLFVPRRFGLGFTINFKYIARKLGWVHMRESQIGQIEQAGDEQIPEETPEDRLRRSIERSRYEDR